MENQQNGVEFLERSNLLLLNIKRRENNIKLVILNPLGETIDRMQLISGKHSIDLSSLPGGEYSVRLQVGENVIVKKINIDHDTVNSK